MSLSVRRWYASNSIGAFHLSDRLVTITAFVVGTVLLAVIGAAYTLFAWHCRRRLGGRALLLLWVGVSLPVGYVGYRHACSGCGAPVCRRSPSGRRGSAQDVW
jgi:hypothetical protein